jgi:hypothetical protein
VTSRAGDHWLENLGLKVKSYLGMAFLFSLFFKKKNQPTNNNNKNLKKPPGLDVVAHACDPKT